MLSESTGKLGTYFSHEDGRRWLAQYVPPCTTGEYKVVHEGQYRLSLLTYHKARQSSKTNRAQQDRLPRYKLLGFFDSVDACRAVIVTLLKKEVGDAE